MMNAGLGDDDFRLMALILLFFIVVWTWRARWVAYLWLKGRCPICFYSGDCDWMADVTEEETYPSDGKTKCMECWRVIPEGQDVHHTYFQEHEECHACYDGECECPARDDGDKVCVDGDCKCEHPSFGETSTYDRCQDCDKFLKAIEASEIDEGCKPHESRPQLGVMVEELRNLEGDNEVYPAKRYFKRAVKMFPELVASGYLGMMARKVF